MTTTLPPRPRLGAPGSIAVVSTYPPTRCGLATFSANLVDALTRQAPDRHVGVVAIDDAPRTDPSVVATLTPGRVAPASAALNQFDAVIVQHEYGIFDGPDGAAVLDLLADVVRPVITVLHTVLERPTPSQRRVLEQVVDHSAATVVMADVARARLVQRYVVDDAKLHVIPHGSWPPVGPPPPRSDDRPVLLTWGLLGPGKGIEAAIDALAQLRDLRPLPRYVVAGQTHPKVRAHAGETYREMLLARARDRGVASMVEFDDRYRDPVALGELIQGADLVVLPYESREQVTSGVLVAAVSGGRPIVATAFPHAVEVCERGAGRTVPHGDTDALAATLRRFLVDPACAARFAAGARRIGRAHSWRVVADRYLQVADAVTRAAITTATDPRPTSRPRTERRSA